MRSDIQPFEAVVGCSWWVVRGVGDAEFMRENLVVQILK
jgi:hypothetical protein